MMVAKGKILVNLDKCYDNFDKAFEVLLKTGTVDHVDNLKSPVLERFRDLRKDGSKIWVNSLWESLNAGYEDDMALIHRERVYGWYVNKGVNMVQTDRPALLLEYLRAKGLHD